MAKYQLQIKKSAEKQLKKIDKKYQSIIVDKILALANNPIPVGAKKLNTNDDTYRIRIGDYRVLYSIENKILVIFVIKIAHRKEVYSF